MIHKIQSLLGNRYLQGLAFWAVAFFVLLRIFTRTDESRIIDVIYTVLFLVPMATAVWVNSKVLIPKYLRRGRYGVYVLMIIPLFGITWSLYWLMFNLISDYLFPGFYFVSVYSPLEIFGIMIIFTGITSLLEFSKSWFREQQNQARLARLEKEKKEQELRALRAQINPHFLFNSLNTIYSEALEKTDKAPELILKLSDMLRYVVENMDKDRVPLPGEVEYLENYVSLQKERLNEPSRVSFKKKGDFEQLEIAPLLLIIFLENCFKHADLFQDNGFIHIELEVDATKLVMHLENTTSPEEEPDAGSPGQGIPNAERRLELVYPESHDLSIRKKEGRYELTLQIERNQLT